MFEPQANVERVSNARSLSVRASLAEQCWTPENKIALLTILLHFRFFSIPFRNIQKKRKYAEAGVIAHSDLPTKTGRWH